MAAAARRALLGIVQGGTPVGTEGASFAPPAPPGESREPEDKSTEVITVGVVVGVIVFFFVALRSSATKWLVSKWPYAKKHLRSSFKPRKAPLIEAPTAAELATEMQSVSSFEGDSARSIEVESAAGDDAGAA